MGRYVAFLRGMNVGGHRITNDELRARFAELGFEGVATFRASGNVIFDADGGRAAELTARIEEGLAESLGYAVPTFVRSAAQIRRIAGHEPFDHELVEASAGKLQVALLSSKPTKPVCEQVMDLATGEDRLAIVERELYWLPSGGILESSLDLDGIGKILGPSTMRTKGTVDRIASKHFASAANPGG